jgi:hypothetical protein
MHELSFGIIEVFLFQNLFDIFVQITKRIKLVQYSDNNPMVQPQP